MDSKKRKAEGDEKQQHHQWTLRPHQEALLRHELGNRTSPGRLFHHNMGSGKTLTVIFVIEALRRFEEFQHAPVLVLTSKTLISGFKTELEKSTHICQTPNGAPLNTRKDLYTITTTQMFYSNPDKFSCRHGFLVIDEAHLLRNPLSKRYQVIFEAAKYARKVYLLTGTLVINYSVDVAPLFNLILADPKRLTYLDAAKLKATCQRTKLPTDSLPVGYLPVDRAQWDKLVQTSAAFLDMYFRCLMSFHADDPNSDDYKLHFPKVTRQLVKVSMTDSHYQVYKQLWDTDQSEPHRPCSQVQSDEELRTSSIHSFQTRVREGPKASDCLDTKFLAWIMKLRMACNHVLGMDEVHYMPKLDFALHHIIASHRASPTYKVALTTTFISQGIRLVQDRLTRAGIDYVTITGQRKDIRNEHEVANCIRRYNTGQVRVVLFSSAGNHGLDLHGTTDCFMINPHWNKAFNKQGESRVIRYDGHAHSSVKAVNIYYMVTVFPERRSSLEASMIPRTADEYLMELSIKKEEENQRIMNMLPKTCVEVTDPDYLARNMGRFRKLTIDPTVDRNAMAKQVVAGADLPRKRIKKRLQ